MNWLGWFKNSLSEQINPFISQTKNKMWKFKFEKIQKKNPESRIWERTWEYQKTRDNLAKTLKKWEKNEEKFARMNYLVEKTVSKEKLTKTEKEFIISLPKEDLDKFLGLLLKKLMTFVHWIHVSGNMDAEELDEWDVKGFLAINKLFDFIKENRKDVRIKRYYFWLRYKIGKYWWVSRPWIYYDD